MSRRADALRRSAERHANDSLDAAEMALAAGLYRPHAGQVPPPGDWTTWLLLAGRGYGKTRTGATWIGGLAKSQPGSRFALIGATHADARSVMVEGESGIPATSDGAVFQPGRRRIYWPDNGSSATLFSAEEPGSLRGPSFHFAWGDEAARWADGPAVLSNLRMALRLGDHPRLLLTTTPLPHAWLKAIASDVRVATTRGRTFDNEINLPAPFLADVNAAYGGTSLGRQELDGEFVEDRVGGLWQHAGFELHRVGTAPPLLRVVVAVDPPAGEGTHVDACGIVVAGLAADGIAYVVADRTVQGISPENWARAVAHAADEFSADLVVAEANNGGSMVRAMLVGADREMNVRLVHASVGKTARAEPISAFYDRGQVRHVGPLPALEDELCGLGAAGAWAGPGRSPDRADALVWALSELLLRSRREPGVRTL